MGIRLSSFTAGMRIYKAQGLGMRGQVRFKVSQNSDSLIGPSRIWELARGCVGLYRGLDNGHHEKRQGLCGEHTRVLKTVHVSKMPFPWEDQSKIQVCTTESDIAWIPASGLETAKILYDCTERLQSQTQDQGILPILGSAARSPSFGAPSTEIIQTFCRHKETDKSSTLP